MCIPHKRWDQAQWLTMACSMSPLLRWSEACARSTSPKPRRWSDTAPGRYKHVQTVWACHLSPFCRLIFLLAEKKLQRNLRFAIYFDGMPNAHFTTFDWWVSVRTTRQPAQHPHPTWNWPVTSSAMSVSRHCKVKSFFLSKFQHTASGKRQFKFRLPEPREGKPLSCDTKSPSDVTPKRPWFSLSCDTIFPSSATQ
jgi:hypothetical protein